MSETGTGADPRPADDIPPEDEAQFGPDEVEAAATASLGGSASSPGRARGSA